jgi:hypothetical protein
VLGAALGDANKEASHASHKQQRAEPVYALHPLRERPACVVVVDVITLTIRLDKEGCGSKPYAVEGEINVEAPAPQRCLYKRPANYQPNNAAH